LGLVGVGVGAYFGLDAVSKKNGYEQHEANGRCVDTQCASLSKDAVNDAALSTVSFVVGGALLGVGAVMWIAAPSDGGERAIAIAPMIGPDRIGAGMTAIW
jgi:hypothetical protein